MSIPGSSHRRTGVLLPVPELIGKVATDKPSEGDA